MGDERRRALLAGIAEPLTVQRGAAGDWYVAGGGHQVSGEGNRVATEILARAYEAERLALRSRIDSLHEK